MTSVQQIRESLIRAGCIFPPEKKHTPRPQNPNRKPYSKKPLPAPFDGTPKQRADHALALAKTGLYALTECARACGYYPSSSVALRELMAGGGRLTDICRNAVKNGMINAHSSINTASLRMIRDYYGFPNENGETYGDEELRRIISDNKERLKEIAFHAGLHADSLRHFARGEYGMRRRTKAKIRAALAELKIL